MSRGKGKAPLHYWDACTFIHAIQGNEPDGGIILKTNLTFAKEGKLRIVTSSMTLAEVVKPKRYEGKPLSPTAKKTVTEVFQLETIVLVDVTVPIAERARELQWLITGLQPVDAIHLATAEYAKVDRFDTYDRNSLIKKVQGLTNSVWKHTFLIGHPTVKQQELMLNEKKKPENQ